MKQLHQNDNLNVSQFSSWLSVGYYIVNVILISFQSNYYFMYKILHLYKDFSLRFFVTNLFRINLENLFFHNKVQLKSRDMKLS